MSSFTYKQTFHYEPYGFTIRKIKPSFRNNNRNRYYTDEDLVKLQQIKLFLPVGKMRTISDTRCGKSGRYSFPSVCTISYTTVCFRTDHV